ncbi:hypothetical protein, partial [Streptomyces vinaceus]|uniref:hypothetical protein n=1 Tax=Streptomyces vinaceus TaxID=1960 RepID=UPI00369C5B06
MSGGAAGTRTAQSRVTARRSSSSERSTSSAHSSNRARRAAASESGSAVRARPASRDQCPAESRRSEAASGRPARSRKSAYSGRVAPGAVHSSSRQAYSRAVPARKASGLPNRRYPPGVVVRALSCASSVSIQENTQVT